MATRKSTPTKQKPDATEPTQARIEVRESGFPTYVGPVKRPGVDLVAAQEFARFERALKQA